MYYFKKVVADIIINISQKIIINIAEVSRHVTKFLFHTIRHEARAARCGCQN